jgi:hypothetical protein
VVSQLHAFPQSTTSHFAPVEQAIEQRPFSHVTSSQEPDPVHSMVDV